MKLTLVENAIDSIKHGLEHYLAGSGNDYKYAILHLVQAVELVYKERLRREHEAFLYIDIDHPKASRTITIEQAQKRLAGLCKVALKDKEIKLVNSLANLRNQIQHYEFEISEESAKAIIAKVLAELVAFCRQHLNLELQDHIGRKSWATLTEVTEFMDAHASKVLHELEEQGRSCEECPQCEYEGLDSSAMHEVCLICGFEREMVECEGCGKVVPEDEIEEFQGVDYDKDGPTGHFSICLCESCRQPDYDYDPY